MDSEQLIFERLPRHFPGQLLDFKFNAFSFGFFLPHFHGPQYLGSRRRLQVSDPLAWSLRGVYSKRCHFRPVLAHQFLRRNFPLRF